MSFTIFYKKKETFQAIKTRSSSNRKIGIFPKGITHGLGPKMASFLTVFFLAPQAKKRCFMIFQNEKTPFEAIKTKRSKSRKIDIFPKGLTHGLSQKMAVFPTLCLGNIGQKNVFYDILQRKSNFTIKTRSSKYRKIDIFPKMVIFAAFFLGNTGKENVFYDILERKNAFRGYENKKFKNSKN